MLIDLALIILASAANAIATLSLKFGDSALRRSLSLGDFATNIDLGFLTALILYGVSLVSYSAALKNLQASVAYPLSTGLAILMVVTVSTLVWQERLSPALILGVFCVITGIALISFNAL